MIESLDSPDSALARLRQPFSLSQHLDRSSVIQVMSDPSYQVRTLEAHLHLILFDKALLDGWSQ